MDPATAPANTALGTMLNATSRVVRYAADMPDITHTNIRLLAVKAVSSAARLLHLHGYRNLRFGLA
jgi:hypothetical protein